MGTQPKNSDQSQISLLLGRAYYSYLGMLGRLLKARGLDRRLRPGIGNILFALQGGRELTATEIRHQLGMARSTMARLVEKVRKLGLIETRPDPKDGRAQRLSLTAEAEALMPDCFELANHIESVICRSFTTEERHTFADLLLRATSNITAELETLESTASTQPKAP